MRAVLWQEKHIQVLLFPRFDPVHERLTAMNGRVIQNGDGSLGDVFCKIIHESNGEIGVDVLFTDIRMKVVVPCYYTNRLPAMVQPRGRNPFGAKAAVPPGDKKAMRVAA